MWAPMLMPDGRDEQSQRRDASVPYMGTEALETQAQLLRRTFDFDVLACVSRAPVRPRRGSRESAPACSRSRCSRSHDNPVELYLATHETTGATALVRKHTAQDDDEPRVTQ